LSSHTLFRGASTTIATGDYQLDHLIPLSLGGHRRSRLGRTDIAGILKGVAGESGDVARSFDCRPYAAGKSMLTSE
jgi:hypothetical protein